MVRVLELEVSIPGLNLALSTVSLKITSLGKILTWTKSKTNEAYAFLFAKSGIINTKYIVKYS